jgi:hypothetical protein
MINAINATKSNSGMITGAVGTMLWSVHAYTQVLALIGKLGNTGESFVL